MEAAETFTAKVQSPTTAPAISPTPRVTATLVGIPGRRIEFNLAKTTLRTGQVNTIGTITLDGSKHSLSHRPRVSPSLLAIEGTPYQNTYPLWIYPAEDRHHRPGWRPRFPQLLRR
jgi:hypothetical protein